MDRISPYFSAKYQLPELRNARYFAHRQQGDLYTTSDGKTHIVLTKNDKRVGRELYCQYLHEAQVKVQAEKPEEKNAIEKQAIDKQAIGQLIDFFERGKMTEMAKIIRILGPHPARDAMRTLFYQARARVADFFTDSSDP